MPYNKAIFCHDKVAKNEQSLFQLIQICSWQGSSPDDLSHFGI